MGLIFKYMKPIKTIITKTRLSKYIENLTSKNWKFSYKNSDIFHISAQNIDCGYSQSMILSRNKKNNVYPCKPQFYYRYVFVMRVKLLAYGLNFKHLWSDQGLLYQLNESMNTVDDRRTVMHMLIRAFAVRIRCKIFFACCTSTINLWRPSRKHTYIILTPLNPTFI